VRKIGGGQGFLIPFNDSRGARKGENRHEQKMGTIAKMASSQTTKAYERRNALQTKKGGGKIFGSPKEGVETS